MQHAQLLAATSALTSAIDALVGLREAISALISAPADQAGNVKAAPFYLNELTTRAILDGDSSVDSGLIAVPVVSAPLVDQPRQAEIASEPELGSRPGDDATSHRGNTGTLQSSTVRHPAARKRDVMIRQAKDRDARELEKPLDAVAPRQRPEKIALPELSDMRPRLGAATGRPKVSFPVPPTFARRQRLQAATAFLRRQCILVQVVDRSALVLTYRVSGKRDTMLAEDVIAYAISRGFESEDNVHG